MASDPRLLKTAGKIFRKAAYNPKTPIRSLRQHYDAVFAVKALPNNIDLRQEEIGTIAADILVPELALGRRTILYAHGGWYSLGSRLASRNLCASLAHESATRLVIPEYRLAPEYPFPTALEDLYNSYAWILRQGTAPSEVVFAGDGSGAALAISLVHYLETKGVPRPAGVVAISPWVDLTCSGPSFSARKSGDPILSRDALVSLSHQYTYQSNFQNPHVSPIFGDFSLFPPLFVQYGTEEILRGDAARLAERARAAGVEVVEDAWDGMWHLFQAIDTLTPNAHLAVRKIGQWVRALRGER